MRPNTTLRRLRDRLNLSQDELAERLRETGRELGLNLAADAKRVGRWERGEVAWPSPAYRRALCALFGVANATELGFRRPPSETPVPVERSALFRRPALRHRCCRQAGRSWPRDTRSVSGKIQA